MTAVRLFFTFLLIGIMTYGGGYSVLPLIDDMIVKKAGWLTEEAVADIVSISEISPGPFSLNCASFVGMKVAGLPGAILATAGFLLPSLVIILVLAFFYNKYYSLSYVRQIFAVLNACIIGVLISSAVSLLRNSVFLGNFTGENIDIAALLIFAGSFLAIFKLKCNPVLIIVISAVAGMLVYPMIK